MRKKFKVNYDDTPEDIINSISSVLNNFNLNIKETNFDDGFVEYEIFKGEEYEVSVFNEFGYITTKKTKNIEDAESIAENFNDEYFDGKLKDSLCYCGNTFKIWTLKNDDLVYITIKKRLYDE
jgi:hypothetical protein